MIIFLVHIGPSRSDGQLGIFAHYENCTFMQNTADEFGSAMGFASLLFFQNIENVIPIEIENWYVSILRKGYSMHCDFLPEGMSIQIQDCTITLHKEGAVDHAHNVLYTNTAN